MPKRKFLRPPPPRLTESISGVPSLPPTIPSGGPHVFSGDPSCCPENFSSARQLLESVKAAKPYGNGKGLSYEKRRELLLGRSPLSGVDLAYRLCRDMGATVADLAAFFEISQSRMEYWLANIPELRDAYVRGRDECDSTKVESKLFTKTQGYEYQEIIKERAWFMDPVTGLKSPGELVVTKEIT